MAKNKKPRKQYKPKPQRMFCADQVDIDDIKSLTRYVGLVTELSLPLGKASADDLSCIKSLLNHALIGFVGRDYLDEKEREDAVVVVNKGGDACVAAVKRACERRDQTGEELRFIFTGDELNAVRDAVAVADQFISDSLDVEPHRTLREFFVMKLLLKRKTTEDITAERVKRVLDELSTMPTKQWRAI